MTYTHEPYMPEVYGNNKMYLVTPEGGQPPFIVSTNNGESEIPRLVELHLNPPIQAAYPASATIADPMIEMQKTIDMLTKRLEALETK